MSSCGTLAGSPSPRGLAMGKFFSFIQQSGLSLWISDQLHPLEGMPPMLASFIITAVIIFFTEFASNTATIVIFLPVLSELAIRLKVHPLYLMIPATVGCSYAFMLPVSTTLLHVAGRSLCGCQLLLAHQPVFSSPPPPQVASLID
uniref:Solute carrier family 13 member 3 n=1 Tax=Molossus molossus TaxID=27622 RepID=A0A7J8HLA1_MOLMO|nr:solute carrier family 13 member 3 [Molossus molossus]